MGMDPVTIGLLGSAALGTAGSVASAVGGKKSKSQTQTTQLDPRSEAIRLLLSNFLVDRMQQNQTPQRFSEFLKTGPRQSPGLQITPDIAALLGRQTGLQTPAGASPDVLTLLQGLRR